MYLKNFIDMFYLIYLLAISGAIFYELRDYIALNKLIIFCLGSTFSILIINIFFSVKVFSCFLEILIIFLLIYNVKVGDLITKILLSSLYALTVSLSRYILILIYSAMFYDLEILKILDLKLFVVFCLLLVIMLLGVLCFLVNLLKDIVKKRVVSIAKYTKITMATGIIIFLSEMIFDNVKIDFNTVYKASMISISIAFYLGITYVCLYKKCRDFNTGFKVDLLERQLDYQKKYYEGIINNYDSAKKALHDMNNHMSVIKYLLENNDYNGLGEYLEQFGEYIPSNKKKYICDNKIVNAICLEKLAICKEKGIHISFDLDISNNIEIDVLDLCIIFGNLLDNAIEACDRISKKNIRKFIEVTATVYVNKLSIRVLNSKDNIVIKEENRFISSKKDKKKHGIGLENVKLSVANNEGSIEFLDSTDKFEVNLYVTLKK